MATMRTESVPDEVCLEILGRMPVKSVVRFLCLNKSWHNLILDNHHYLADLHYSHDKSYSTSNYLVQREIKSGLPLLEGEVNDDEEDAAENLSTYEATSCYRYFSLHGGTTLMQYEKLDRPCEEPSCTIIGSYNGVVLVMDNDSGLHLWNPSIHKVRSLPIHPNLIRFGHLYFYGPQALAQKTRETRSRNITAEGYECKSSIGLGFCQTNKDFKVVYVVTLYDPGTGEMASQDVDVYSLASDSWESSSVHETTTAALPADPHISRHITFEGNPHWVERKKKGDPLFIISFDFHSEQFQTISKVQLPLRDGRLGAMEPWTYKDMFGVLRGIRRRSQGSSLVLDCELWVLKGYHGVDENSSSWSWTQVLSLPNLPFSGTPLNFTHDGHLLIWDRRNRNNANAIISTETSTTYNNDDDHPSFIFRQHVIPRRYLKVTLGIQMISYRDSLFLLF